MRVGGMQGVAVDPAGTFTGGCDPRRDGYGRAGVGDGRTACDRKKLSSRAKRGTLHCGFKGPSLRSG